MAFGGVLFVNLILTIVMAIIVPGILCIIAGIALALIHFIRKRLAKPTKKWIPITSIILTILGFCALVPFFVLLLISA